MNDNLAGKTCLVTGASRGIGAAIALALAQAGARVVVHYARNAQLAAAVVESLPGTGHVTLSADLAEPAAAGSLVEHSLALAGRLDVLVNNAGIFVEHAPQRVTADEWLACWEQTIAVNLVSPAVLSRAAAAAMAEQGGGRIVNVGSRGAFRGEPDSPAYAASKAGLHAMSQSLAVALAPRNVLVYAVAPGFVETEMAQALLDGAGGDSIRQQSPLQRVATAQEIAEVVLFLASTAPAYLTGAVVDINGASYLR